MSKTKRPDRGFLEQLFDPASYSHAQVTSERNVLTCKLPAFTVEFRRLLSGFAPYIDADVILAGSQEPVSIVRNMDVDDGVIDFWSELESMAFGQGQSASHAKREHVLAIMRDHFNEPSE